MTASDPIVIVACARTPMGSMQGCFSSLSAPQLGSAAIKAAIDRAGLKPSHLTGNTTVEAIMGNVLSAGLGQAPARQAALGAGLPLTTQCTTINKMCGSGMKAVMLAHDSLLAGSSDMVFAGGMESMTNAPYLLDKVRRGLRLGHSDLLDHMFLDGLEDAYEKDALDKRRLMGWFAELCAEKYQFSRKAQDAFAIRSTERAIKASQQGWFKDEIIPVKVTSRKGDHFIDTDQPPFAVNIDKIPLLKPVFKEGGSVTAANASSIADGASAMLLMRASEAKKQKLKPKAIILGHATHAQEPRWFTTAPVMAIGKLLDKLNWQTDDVDLYEINEAFAVVTMAAIKELALDAEKVNIHGGACALGHPIGASGNRILVTLIHALEQHGFKRGVASLCIGGGEATAMAVELCE